MPQTSKLTLGRALKHGFKLAVSEPWTVLLGFLAEAGESLMTTGFQVAFALAMFSWIARWLSIQVAPLLGAVSPYEGALSPMSHVMAPLAGGALAAAIIVMLLRGIWAGALVRRFSRRLLELEAGRVADGPAATEEGERPVRRDGEAPTGCVSAAPGAEVAPLVDDGGRADDGVPPVLEGFGAFPKVAAFSLAFLPVAATALLVGATVIAVCLLLLNAALSQGSNLLLCAAAMALGLTLMFAVTRGACVAFRLGVVRMLTGARDVLDALADAMRILFQRAGFFALLFFVFSIMESVAVSSTTVMEGFWKRLGTVVEAPALAVVFLALLVALAALECAGMALVVSAEYGALTAVVLDDAGLLPDPPEPRPPAGRGASAGGAHGPAAPSEDHGDGEIVETSPFAPEAAEDDDVIVETSAPVAPLGGGGVGGDGKASEGHGDGETVGTSLSAPEAAEDDGVIVETSAPVAPFGGGGGDGDGKTSEGREACPAAFVPGGDAVVETAAVPEAAHDVGAPFRQEGTAVPLAPPVPDVDAEKAPPAVPAVRHHEAGVAGQAAGGMVPPDPGATPAGSSAGASVESSAGASGQPSPGLPERALPSPGSPGPSGAWEIGAPPSSGADTSE